MRAKLSAPPAGVNGTMMVTGLLGNVWACAAWNKETKHPKKIKLIVFNNLKVLKKPILLDCFI
jgi:hypothetical protein